MNNDIEGILDRFDRVLKNYEIDKKIGNLSVDSIYHLFPNEMITIKNYITKLQEENNRLNNIINTFEEEIEVELTFEDKDCLLEHNTFITIHDTLEKVLKRIKELKEGK